MKNNKHWHIASWSIEWLKDCIGFVGYIYDHPKFKNGQKIFIKINAKRKYKYVAIY